MRLTALERAFQLARSGDYESVPKIREQLTYEGLGANQIVGPVLIRQLRLLCVANFDPSVSQPDARSVVQVRS